MSDNSRIEWTDATWSPTLGCTRVSAGCDNCYAIRTAHRLGANPDPKISAAFAGLTEHRDGRLDWTSTVRHLPDRLDKPLRWKRPRRIFVDSMSDLFHHAVSDGFIGSVFEVMAKTPQHTYQLLTKRAARMRTLLTRWAAEGARHDWAGQGTAVFRRDDMAWVGPVRWPLPNVHLGVSVENQHWARIRIPALLTTPAAVRWISAEPLIGPLDLRLWLGERLASEATAEVAVAHGVGSRRYDAQLRAHFEAQADRAHGQLAWVVAGGESGPGARPAHPDWFRQLRDQCAAAEVPFNFKQRGEWTWDMGPDDPWWDTEPSTWIRREDGTVVATDIDASAGGSWQGVWRVGKKRAGRLLDGFIYDEYPTGVTE